MSFLSGIFGSKTSTNSNVKLLTPEEFRTHVENNKVQLVDVRTPLEFRSGHIKGAKNIDFYSGKFNVEFDKLNKEASVYVYCRSGNRSRQTARKLSAMGFKNIYDLRGGIMKY